MLGINLKNKRMCQFFSLKICPKILFGLFNLIKSILFIFKFMSLKGERELLKHNIGERKRSVG